MTVQFHCIFLLVLMTRANSNRLVEYKNKIFKETKIIQVIQSFLLIGTSNHARIKILLSQRTKGCIGVKFQFFAVVTFYVFMKSYPTRSF